jgi:dsRNA-specific ribonuclease
MSEGVLHYLRQLLVSENQYRQFSRGDKLEDFLDLIKVNN